MNAVDYAKTLIEQQKQKIKDLDDTVEAQRQILFMTMGAAQDARQDLKRFDAHLQAMLKDQPIPPLVPETK